jgi:3-hydroxyacyl-CoA dehydrogenase
MVEKGRMKEGKARHLSSLLKGTLHAQEFADCDFVIEAVFEQMEVKKQVFAEVEAVLRSDALLASNTSGLSLTQMASDLDHPERVIGFHFFNPVAVLPLVEIVQAGKSDAATLATAFELAGKLKKTAILVKDSPAFLVNRILIRMLVDCLELVEEGAGFRQVDEALLALGLPMAPFELLSLVGLPVALHVMEALNRAFGSERFPVDPNFRKLERRGFTSVKAGPSVWTPMWNVSG